MSLDASQVREIAHLARLAVDEADTREYAASLSSILEFVEQLAAVESSGVTPLAHPLEMNQRLRPDEVSESDQRERFQAIAPAVEDGYYLVPRVIE
ncbi:Asp-tRNA(Asn)/Glu-tRNA(Gln) amidotransferase subunit GatC [Sediminicurvatus halobius]|uniref:Aspartyl/glutamyl-tRNA(Asn/Gln) amidotransferase subunit C n=1 Tax=Sediminicurvatus halobius TaxID=2182432 RepID=A0A2U2N7R4_9GAMM|nr:Asp-tRNA(Asn)/Glu-tRNA(Gln) amidotransferase subunit GatC [Spiribacter halobius]PWG65235.1 Asp-tRNA(Asn)/Glu-tRNA(Gln) amidotransferase GatCAB subunit C [Spiribacter halobius]UEX78811.1 Asp-tRNA(Asn)/Glu-tRNA(Gln) amidotransferase subunit GatC [Spiribacter halobius]